MVCGSGAMSPYILHFGGLVLIPASESSDMADFCPL
jgi:hypothetical protein